MKHEKILDRIRKLLAMSKDTASPHEAAIASKRARKLMDEYQISEMDLTIVDNDDFGESYFNLGTKQTNVPLGTLAIACAQLNDCQVRWSRINNKMNLKFSGMLADIACSIEMMKYLKAEMYRQAERNAYGRADRFAYRAGFSTGVLTQVEGILREREQLKTSSGTSLVICKQQMVESRFGECSYGQKRSSMTGSAYAHAAGFRAGSSAGLNRQVSGTSRARIA